jgi:hypothetical protein
VSSLLSFKLGAIETQELKKRVKNARLRDFLNIFHLF